MTDFKLNHRKVNTFAGKLFLWETGGARGAAGEPFHTTLWP